MIEPHTNRRLRTMLAASACALLAVAAPLGAQEFSLRSGDAIRLTIPREKEMSGLFEVDATNAVALPLVGRVELTKRPWSEVRTALLAAYARQLREPGITLIPMRHVVVLGAVNKPGTYLVEPDGTLAAAVAAASGVTPEGDLRRVRLVRDSVLMKLQATGGRPINDIPVQSGDQIYVMERSWAVRNMALIVTSLLTLTGLIAAFHPRL